MGLTLVFHPPVLEPDFDLSLRQVQGRGDLDPPGPTQVLVEVELLLQLQELGVGVGCTQSAGVVGAAVGARSIDVPIVCKMINRVLE